MLLLRLFPLFVLIHVKVYLAAVSVHKYPQRIPLHFPPTSQINATNMLVCLIKPRQHKMKFMFDSPHKPSLQEVIRFPCSSVVLRISIANNRYNWCFPPKPLMMFSVFMFADSRASRIIIVSPCCFYWHCVSHIHISKLILTPSRRTSRQTSAHCICMSGFP